MHVTSAVFSDNRGRRFEGVRIGEEGEGVHHFIVWDWREARRTQEDMLASWSRDERISSLWGGRERIWERLEKSWVVEGPITGTRWESCQLGVMDARLVVGRGERGKEGEDGEGHTDFIDLSTHELRSCFQAFILDICRLLGDIVAGAQLHIRLL